MSDKIILVQPRIGFIDKIAYDITIPIAPLSISRLLNEEFDVTIIDQRVEKTGRKGLLKS